MIVYAIVDDALSPDFPLGDAVATLVRREDAKRFIEESRATSLSSRATYGSRSGRWRRAASTETS